MSGTATSGGRGTRTKTRRQHELDGTFRKDRHSDLRNPEPSTGRPEPPGELEPVASAEWERMLWAFEDMGMLAKVDAFAVYQYCRLYAETEAIAVEQAEARDSLKILEENVPAIRNEHATMLVELFQEIVMMRKLVSKATDQLRAGRMAIRQYLVEFGLTPASRGRIKLPAKAEEVDEFAKQQQARPQLSMVK